MKAIRCSLVFILMCASLTPLIPAQQQETPTAPATPVPVSAPPASQLQQNFITPSPSPGADSLLGDSPDRFIKQKYLLGPGDILDLRVYNEPQFSGPVMVTDEGFVEVPFIGAIPASCRTDAELRQEVTRALGKYLRSPQVSLYLKEAKSRPPAIVFGAVRSPQRVEMKRRVHLLDLLAASGGVTEQASGDIQIFHTEAVMCPERESDLVHSAIKEKEMAQANPEEASIYGAFSIYKLSDLKLGKPEANPFIRPGDIIIVPEAYPIYITGAVYQPQGLPLREKMQLTRALAMVGGVRKDAKTNKVRLFRTNRDSQALELVTVDFDAIRKQKQPDIYLQPYDVIDVPDASGILHNIKSVMLNHGMQGLGSAATGLPLRVLY